jgi:hypothetical protein
LATSAHQLAWDIDSRWVGGTQVEVASTTWAEAAVERPSAANAVRVLNFSMASSRS